MRISGTCFCLGTLTSLVLFAGSISVTTDHFDNLRQAWNSSEIALIPSSVQPGKFAKLGSFPVDASVWAQPLIISNVTIGGKLRELMITATMNCTLYAFDTDQPNSAPLWSQSLCTPRSSYPNKEGFLYNGTVGCLSTPAIDVSLGYIFAACVTSAPSVVLYKVAITSGTVAASVSVTGSYGGATFDPSQELPRSGITIANGNAYIAFSAYDDVSPWYGWMIGYAESDLSQIGAWCSTPSGTENGGGIWQTSGGVAALPDGSLIFATGNGSYDGTNNFANSIVKLSPSLTLSDWFTPSNYAELDSGDLDMASGRVMVLPGTTLIALGEKNFEVYVVDYTCMGHLQGSGSGCATPQIFSVNPSGTITFSSGIYGGLFMNGMGYWPTTNGKIFSFAFSGGAFSTSPAASSAASYAFPGAQMSGSTNGGSNGIVWALTFLTSAFHTPSPGTLVALDPSTLAVLWNSDQRTLGLDSLGNVPKFASPTVANGKVFVPTLSGGVAEFGLVSDTQISGQVTVSGQVTIQ